MGRPKAKKDFKDVSVDGMIVLTWIFRRKDGETCTGVIWFRLCVVGSLFRMWL